MGNRFLFNAADAEDISFLPNFCDVRIIFMVVLLVEILAMVLAMATPSTTSVLWDNLAIYSLLLQWIALINAALLCALRNRLNALSHRWLVAASFGLMMTVSIVFGLILLELTHYFGIAGEVSPLGDHFMPRIIGISAFIYVLVLRFFYIQQQWKLNLKSHTRAEIQALKARIRPHFLFNSMNTIASLIDMQPEKAEKAVEDLSDLFRASLHERTLHSIADELDLVRSYLAIEQLRLGDRLKIDWDVDNSLKDEEIPALCLQPLAENAIYHGIEPLTEGGHLGISARREHNQLVLSVSNPVSGDGQTSHHTGNHMAQENIRQRLDLVYGGRAEFLINDTKHTYTVSLKIPLDGES